MISCADKVEVIMRIAGANGEATERAIREVAVRIIAQHGYQAASLRMIAREIGLQAPSLYNYIKSKEQLLFELLHEPIIRLLKEYRSETIELIDPFESLKIFIRIHLNFHLDYRLEVFIGNMELRNLTESHYKQITNLRDEYSSLLTEIIEGGAKSGVFSVEDARVTTFAMLSMLSGVCNWFRPDGLLTKARVMEIHTRLALEMLGLDPLSATEVISRKTKESPRSRGSRPSAKPKPSDSKTRTA